jgi:hypothetical protein
VAAMERFTMLFECVHRRAAKIENPPRKPSLITEQKN